MSRDKWQPIETKPKEVRVFWGWNQLDGVQRFAKGVGSDDWWLSDGYRAWAPPVKWQPLEPPPPPAPSGE
jgi:hypothetical protein